MAFSHALLRSVLDRLALTSCIVAPLTAIVLVAPLDAALARSGANGNYGSSAPTQSRIATLPVKQPIRHPVVINGPKPMLGVKPVLSKREREVTLLRMLDRCSEHGGCSGVIRPVGSPKPLQPYPVSFPIGAKPLTGSGGTWVDTSGGYPIGSGSQGTATGTGAGGTGGTSGGGGTQVNAPPTKPPVPTDPGHGAPSKASGGGSPTDKGGTSTKQF